MHMLFVDNIAPTNETLVEELTLSWRCGDRPWSLMSLGGEELR